jgi:septal ring factor EnvC (AmiA/AmiB activator)
MAILFGRAVGHDLTSMPLVLAPAAARRGPVVAAVVVAALLAGAGATHLYWSQQLGPLQAQVASMKDLPQLEQQLEQARQRLRLAEAHGSELERQIDALNQRLLKAQEEVAFIRKARDGRPKSNPPE